MSRCEFPVALGLTTQPDLGKKQFGTSESFNVDKREVFEEIFQKSPYIEKLYMRTYNPLGIPWATSETET